MNTTKRRISVTVGVVLMAALFVPGILSTANADTISSVTDGVATSGGAAYWGETVTIIVGKSWNSLSLNFYDATGAAQAVGDVYLLSQAYLGTPANLSSSTPGFIAEGIATGGFYNFQSAVTVLGGTKYWVYTDAAMQLTGNGAGNQFYFSTSATSNFTGVPGNDINYTLTGTLIPTPEPSTSILMLAGVGLIGLMLMRKRKAQGLAQAT